MKCLSLWQPWATLIVIGAKRIETRHWETSHRGPLLIHAAKKWNREFTDLVVRPPFRDALESAGVRPVWDLPLGCIVGVVNLVDIWTMSDTPGVITKVAQSRTVSDREQEFGNFAPGRFAWQFAQPFRFAKPVPQRGFQQIFDVPDHVVAEQLRGRAA